VKINSATASPPGAAATSAKNKIDARPAQGPAGGAADRVELSAAARLQSAALADTEPVVNAAHVAHIKQAIREGRFQIDPERIADGLLANVRQMLSRQR
jgi:negative regulator of flagellin synthesis FlgM